MPALESWSRRAMVEGGEGRQRWWKHGVGIGWGKGEVPAAMDWMGVSSSQTLFVEKQNLVSPDPTLPRSVPSSPPPGVTCLSARRRRHGRRYGCVALHG